MNQTTPITVGGQRATAKAALDGARSRAASLYIHVPFCFHKCHYCDFYSFVDSRDRQEAFVRALETELGAMAPAATSLESIFVGGGTPSLLRPDLWERLLATIHRHFDCSATPEFTVECNPETVTEELAAVLAGGGVNRASVGAQSFDERQLKALERWHDPANVERSLSILRDAGIHRRSVDLIFGIPGQTVKDWVCDLETALGLLDGQGIEHLSAYALTYEPGTAMTKKLELGRLDAIDEDLETEMQMLTWSMLEQRGFSRYEVSNFAKPGAECRHNLAYWRQHEWLAAGPSASGHSNGWRWKNIPRLTDWINSVNATGGWCSVTDLEPPDPLRALAERIMTGLRLREGLDYDRLLADAEAIGAAQTLGQEIRRHADRGDLVVHDGQLVLNAQGWLFADGIASSLMQTLDPTG